MLAPKMADKITENLPGSRHSRNRIGGLNAANTTQGVSHKQGMHGQNSKSNLLKAYNPISTGEQKQYMT
jgi:hypothetical protein